MKPSERIRELAHIQRYGFPESSVEMNIIWAVIHYLDEQYDITNSTTNMKKAKKVNKLKKAVTAKAKKALKAKKK